MQQKSFDIPSGLYIPAVSVVDSVTGSPYSLSSNFYAAVSFGLVPGITRIAASGNNPDVDTGTVPEDCWSGGGLYPWMTGATSLEVVSTSANDTSAGTGARSVVINGLDVNFNPVIQTITLNGLTAVAVPLQLYRINSAVVTSVGTIGSNNNGDIVIRNSGAGTTRAIIPANFGMTRQSPYTVPAGFSLLITSLYIGVESPSGAVSQYANMSTYFKSATTNVARLPITIGTTNGNPYRHDIEPGILVTEKTDFSLKILNTSDNNANVTCAWNGILRAN